MAVPRDTPYSQFNFQVKFGTTQAGFQEVAGLGTEVHVAEYRNGNKGDNSTIKVMGLPKYSDVTFKRGVCGDLATLWTPFQQVLLGNGNTDATRALTVTISLMDETGNTAVQTWTLSNARPMKLTGPSLTGKGTDVAIEELVMCCERIEQS
jgi:phage tail-like protein